MSERTRVVVVGHGMAGAKLVDRLAARDRDGRCAVTVFGAEPQPAYNRMLLSAVVAGQYRLDDVRMGDPPPGVDVRTGVAVTALDRGRREVLADDGSRTPYDVLVLATGGRAWVPPLAGLAADDGGLLPGATVFRTLDDCRRLVAAAGAGRRAVVLGGGPLGLEAARALRTRGLHVEVVHPQTHLMERHLDRAAGRVLARTLAGLGVRVRSGAAAVGVLGAPGRVEGVALTDDTEIPADLLVVACGVRPDVALAADAGLAVAAGVVVDDALRSVTDPRVYAVGDCAEHAGQVYGLVAPAWEQAAVVADQVTGADPGARYAGSRRVVRLRADDVELAALGDAGVADGGDTEVVVFTDPVRGTYRKMVVRNGRLVSAVLLGGLETVGTVTQVFDRGSPLPADRLSLLFTDADRPDGVGAPGVPATGTVCRCNGVGAEAVRACHLAGARTVADVAAATRATTGCGGCRDHVAALLESWGEPPALPLPG